MSSWINEKIIRYRFLRLCLLLVLHLICNSIYIYISFLVQNAPAQLWPLNSLEDLMKTETYLTFTDIVLMKPGLQMLVDNAILQSCLKGVFHSTMKALKDLNSGRCLGGKQVWFGHPSSPTSTNRYLNNMHPNSITHFPNHNHGTRGGRYGEDILGLCIFNKHLQVIL